MPRWYLVPSFRSSELFTQRIIDRMWKYSSTGDLIQVASNCRRFSRHDENKLLHFSSQRVINQIALDLWIRHGSRWKLPANPSPSSRIFSNRVVNHQYREAKLFLAARMQLTQGTFFPIPPLIGIANWWCEVCLHVANSELWWLSALVVGLGDVTHNKWRWKSSRDPIPRSIYFFCRVAALLPIFFAHQSRSPTSDIMKVNLILLSLAPVHSEFWFIPTDYRARAAKVMSRGCNSESIVNLDYANFVGS